jgi:hypothetical protein
VAWGAAYSVAGRLTFHGETKINENYFERELKGKYSDLRDINK